LAIDLNARASRLHRQRHHGRPSGSLIEARIADREAILSSSLETKQSTELADARVGERDALRDRSELDFAIRRWRESLEQTVEALAATIALRDPYTARHQRRVAKLAGAIAIAMQLPREQAHGLVLAAHIHDVGKLAVPLEILIKPAQLSELEFALMRTHSQSGSDIVRYIDFPWPVAAAILQHHERLDGSGYPHGIAGAAMLTEAKILAVADVVEAMSSDRPYRRGLGIDAALAEMMENRGRLYDEAAVEACFSLFREEGFQFE
jgi:putative two-component system response regulator